MELATSATPTTPPGWHPDPHAREQLRWWSGAQWTEHVRPLPPVAAQSVAAAPAAAPAAAVFQPTDPRALHASRANFSDEIPAKYGESMLDQNSISFAAIGISIAYLVFALTTGIALAGILPAMVTVRAFNAKEKLAPIALVAAGSAIAVAFA